MPIKSFDKHPARPAEPYEARAMAESFGVDPQRYDAARPGYPDALIARIVTAAPGRDVLDVGCGTGIAARQLRAAGCAALGVEPDRRMAEVARADGLAVEEARFEQWDPAGRTFDAVVAAQAWHWVEPVAGAAKAADVLRPSGLLVIFGHVFEPPAEIAEAFATAFRRLVPHSPFSDQPVRRPVEMYQTMYGKFAHAICRSGRFHDPEQWRFDWEREYTRQQWLGLLATTGGLTQVPADTTAKILAAVGRTIDSLGGGFTMQYTTLAVAAVRADET